MPTAADQTSELWIDEEARRAGCGPRVFSLSPQEFAMLAALAAADGRVVSRTELRRRAGIGSASDRRADSVLVNLRRVLGADSVRTIRSRGWALDRDAIEPA